MLDVTPLETAVDRLADRLRAAPRSRLRRGAAAQGLELARELAVRAQRIEFPGREPLVMPEAGLFTVADQVAVAGHDLAAALRGADGGTGGVGTDGGGADAVAAELSEAVALVRAAAQRCGC
ncbi:hypothetical protein DMH02_007325 [Streptomyces sp. WAC 00631]|uniref:hypothetical protein n=1 Tax=unclassified Streptomyces TaxID=2593676 RepID=UPI000F78641E|nr:MULTISPECIES: hypothetical protein [unclassified Streptomyces]MCC5033041.1 hypothetical protein [Streptomyces sp. WAC 00631]MCC9741124.1 hypothetical protein [Streptomyces sp. MNU89]